MNPILLDFPDHIDTNRLILRLIQIGDGPEINTAVVESAAELAQWMPWARPTPTLNDTEICIRQGIAKIVTRTNLHWRIDLRGGRYLGTISLDGSNWDVPKVEIGYWLRTSACGHGYMTEAVSAVTRFCFETLNVARIQIRCDNRNTKSANVAERASYQLEGIHRQDSRGPNNEL